MRIIKLQKPKIIVNGFATCDNEIALVYLSDVLEVYNAFLGDRLHCRFISGHRCGSIVKFVPHPNFQYARPAIDLCLTSKVPKFIIANDYFGGICYCAPDKKRKQLYSLDDEIEFLIGYQGDLAWRRPKSLATV
jgi:hypothetical protein